jgi:general stress protein 26
MNSINREQPEKNHADLHGRAAIDKIRQLVDKAQSCFFCTRVSSPGPHPARPMNVRDVDQVGDLWFLSASDSHKNLELETDPSARLFFQASPHTDFLELNGHAHVLPDRPRLDELWEPALKTWFTQGKNDPRITVIRFTPTDGYYWDTKHGMMVAGIKMIIGAAIGKTLDDSIEGRVRLH